MLPVETPECQKCAACCFSQLARYVRVTGDDYARLGEVAESYVCFIGNRAYLRVIDGHCAALRYDLEQRQFVCQVYERRPDICRELARGSAACAGERDAKGERPLAYLWRET